MRKKGMAKNIRRFSPSAWEMPQMKPKSMMAHSAANGKSGLKTLSKTKHFLSGLPV